MSKVKGFDNGKNSEASAPALWVCVSLSDTAVAMVAEFSQKNTKRGQAGGVPEENIGEGRWLWKETTWPL